MKKKVLILVNHDVVIYNFRLELVERLLHDGHEVFISCPEGEKMKDLVTLGAVHKVTEINRHGTNPLQDLKLLKRYGSMMDELKPDVVLGYTIKPNLYGAMAAKRRGIPFIANITGLGTAVENPELKQRVFIAMYKYAFSKVRKVFVQNEENREFFVRNHIAEDKLELIPGSGVNLERFPVTPYPDDGIIRFAFLSRIMKEKGTDIYLESAKVLKKKYANTEFHVCGFCEEAYEERLEQMTKAGIINYHGMIRNVAEFVAGMSCIVHPTYYPEGLSNVLLEACASGRPIITTDRSGCREVVEHGVNGYMVRQRDAADLIDKMEQFIRLEHEQKVQMGLNARTKVEREFDRQLVVEAYMDEINLLTRK